MEIGKLVLSGQFGQVSQRLSELAQTLPNMASSLSTLSSQGVSSTSALANTWEALKNVPGNVMSDVSSLNPMKMIMGLMSAFGLGMNI